MRLFIILGIILCLGVADSQPVSVVLLQHAHELPADDNEEKVLIRNQASKQQKKNSFTLFTKANLRSGILPVRPVFSEAPGAGQSTADFIILYRNIRI